MFIYFKVFVFSEKPKLIEEPNDIDVSFGGTAHFSCKADGDPKPDIVWLHNR